VDVVRCDSFERIWLCDRLREGACCEGGRGISDWRIADAGGAAWDCRCRGRCACSCCIWLINEGSLRTLREPAMTLGDVSFWKIGLKLSSLALLDDGESHSRSRFIEGGLGWGNGKSPMQASSYRTSLATGKLDHGEALIGTTHQSLPAECQRGSDACSTFIHLCTSCISLLESKNRPARFPPHILRRSTIPEVKTGIY